MKLNNLREALDELFDFAADLPSGLDGFESDFDAAFAELKEAEAALNWIPVTEQLPERSVDVLVCTAEGYVGTDFIDSEGEWFWNDELPPAHWMPLPEPPHEDAK